MELGLQDKGCVVTGASRGIGRAIALGLAAEGASVSICARSEEALRATERELRGHQGKVHAATCDVGDPAALGAYLDAAREEFGSVDVLVHNASALAVTSDLAAWEASIRIDLMAAVHACEKVVPWMRASGGGSILLVSSISGIEASPSPDYAYTSVKAALLAFAKKLAVQQAPHGIRVNAVAPGSIDFPGGVWDHVRQNQPEVYEAVRTSIPFGRYGTPEEVADAAIYLVSPRAGWITGVGLAVDGGQHRAIR
jgi:3-oxoacyl-[acyl-carrier protein] reductase